jgi:hypothetical protein
MESLLYFVRWYYTTAIVDGIYTAGNYCWNIGRIFSVGALLKTLFSPYRRVHDEAPSLFTDPSGYFEALTGNIISRAVGFLIRILVLIFALFIFVVSSLVSGFLLVLWITLPIIMPYMLMQSVTFLV